MKTKIKTCILKIGVLKCNSMRSERFDDLQAFLSKLSSLEEVKILKIIHKNTVYKSYDDLIKIVFKMPIDYIDIVSMVSQYRDLIIVSVHYSSV